MNEASTIIQSAAHEDANIIFGAVLDEKMKDEVKITVIATGFKDAARSREHANAAANAVLNRVPHVRGSLSGANLGEAAASATFQVPSVPEPETASDAPSSSPQGAPSLSPGYGDRVGSGPRINERPRNVPYIPDSTDDLDLESEIVRHAEPMHAEPVEEARAAAATYSREAESTYATLRRNSSDPASEPEEPPTIDTVSSSVNISYDANDLEIPAFLRKRGEN